MYDGWLPQSSQTYRQTQLRSILSDGKSYKGRSNLATTSIDNVWWKNYTQYSHNIIWLTMSGTNFHNQSQLINANYAIGIRCKKSLQIPKGESESVYRKRTDNTTA